MSKKSKPGQGPSTSATAERSESKVPRTSKDAFASPRNVLLGVYDDASTRGPTGKWSDRGERRRRTTAKRTATSGSKGSGRRGRRKGAARTGKKSGTNSRSTRTSRRSSTTSPTSYQTSKPSGTTPPSSGDTGHGSPPSTGTTERPAWVSPAGRGLSLVSIPSRRGVAWTPYAGGTDTLASPTSLSTIFEDPAASSPTFCGSSTGTRSEWRSKDLLCHSSLSGSSSPPPYTHGTSTTGWTEENGKTSNSCSGESTELYDSLGNGPPRKLVRTKPRMWRTISEKDLLIQAVKDALTCDLTEAEERLTMEYEIERAMELMDERMAIEMAATVMKETVTSGSEEEDFYDEM